MNNSNADNCFSETTALLENGDIIEAYNNMSSSNDDKMLDPSYFIMNHKYSDDTFVYQTVCQEYGGVVRQLSLHATCVQQQEQQNSETTNTYEMTITDFVRCYGTSCGASQEQALFEKFTLRPTELRNTIDGEYITTNTTCNGTLVHSRIINTDARIAPGSPPEQQPLATDLLAVNSTMCLEETALLNKDKAIATAFQDLAVKSSSQMENITYDDKRETIKVFTLNYVVTVVPSNTRHIAATSCEQQGGIYTEIDLNFSCASRDYRITNAPQCLGKSCDGEHDSEMIDETTAISSLFHLYGSNSSTFFHADKCASSIPFLDQQSSSSKSMVLDTNTRKQKERSDGAGSISIGGVVGLLSALAIAAIASLLLLSLYNKRSSNRKMLDENAQDFLVGKSRLSTSSTATRQRAENQDLENGQASSTIQEQLDHSILFDDSGEQWPEDVAY